MRLNRLRNRLKSRSNPKRRTETSNARKKRPLRELTHTTQPVRNPQRPTPASVHAVRRVPGMRTHPRLPAPLVWPTASRRIGVGLVIEWRIRADRRPTRPRSAWTAQPPGACLRRQRARCADRRRPRGDLSVASRPRHRRGRAGRQPAAGRYVTAREHAGRHAGPARADTDRRAAVEPPGRIVNAGSAAPVAAAPASAPAVEAATPAPQVATTVTNPAPSPSGPALASRPPAASIRRNASSTCRRRKRPPHRRPRRHPHRRRRRRQRLPSPPSPRQRQSRSRGRRRRRKPCRCVSTCGHGATST